MLLKIQISRGIELMEIDDRKPIGQAISINKIS